MSGARLASGIIGFLKVVVAPTIEMLANKGYFKSGDAMGPISYGVDV